MVTTATTATTPTAITIIIYYGASTGGWRSVEPARRLIGRVVELVTPVFDVVEGHRGERFVAIDESMITRTEDTEGEHHLEGLGKGVFRLGKLLKFLWSLPMCTPVLSSSWLDS